MQKLEVGDKVVFYVFMNTSVIRTIGTVDAFDSDGRAVVRYKYHGTDFRGLFDLHRLIRMWTLRELCELVYVRAMKTFMNHGPDKLKLKPQLRFKSVTGRDRNVDCCDIIAAAILGGAEFNSQRPPSLSGLGVRLLWEDAPKFSYDLIKRLAYGFDITVVGHTLNLRTHGAASIGRRLALDLFDLGFEPAEDYTTVELA